MSKSSLGEKIRQLRVEKKMTQAELAGEDMTAAFISSIERGMATPSDKMLEAIARRLDKPIYYFRSEIIDQRFLSIATTINRLSVLIRQQELSEAKKQLDLLHPEITSCNERSLRAEYHLLYGEYYKHTCRCEDAIYHYRLAMDLFLELGYKHKAIETYCLLSETYHSTGNVNQAVRFMEAGLNLAAQEELYDMSSVKGGKLSLANMYYKAGNMERAMTYYQSGIREEMNPHRLTDTFLQMSQAAHALGHHAQALELSSQARKLAETIAHKKAIARCSLLATESLYHMNKIEQATKTLDIAFGQLCELKDTDLLSQFYSLKARIINKQQGAEAAWRTIEEGGQLLALKDPVAQANLLMGEAELYSEDVDKAIDATVKAASIYQNQQLCQEAAVTWSKAADMCLKTNRKDEALNYLQLSNKLLQQCSQFKCTVCTSRAVSQTPSTTKKYC